MPRTIPQIREALHAVSARLLEVGEPGSPLGMMALEISELADETKRKAPTRKVVRKKFPKPTDEEADEIATYAAAFPDAQLLEIANCFHTSQGRVSEIINGFRDADQ